MFDSKVLSYDIKIIVMSEIKDLIVLITMDNSIVLKRIANKSKRIAKIDENYDITSA